MSTARPERPRSKYRVVILPVQALVVLLLVFLGLWYARPGDGAAPLVQPMCVLLVALLGWQFWSWWRMTGSFLDPYILFLASATVFNGGHAFLEVLRLNAKGVLKGQFAPETTLAALYLVALGMAAFHFGGLLAVAHKRLAPAREEVAVCAMPRRVAQLTRFVGWGLLALAMAPYLMQARKAVETVLASGYLGLFQQPARTGYAATPQVLASFLLVGAFYLLAGSQGRRGAALVSGLVVLGNAVFQFYLGSRAAAAMPLVAYAWLWHRTVRPIPTVLLIGGAAALLGFVFPAVVMVRHLSGSERMTLPGLVTVLLSIKNPLVVAIGEMGNSLMTVAYTLQLVPAVRGFDWGRGYLYALTTAFPNLFWPRHPAVARGLASDWLIWTVAPAAAKQGMGYGFSFVAEAYLNFGWLGAPVVLAIMGFLYAKLVLWADDSHCPVRMAAVAAFLPHFLFFARGESASIVRPLVWYALMPYVLVQVGARLRWRRKGASAAECCSGVQCAEATDEFRARGVSTG